MQFGKVRELFSIDQSIVSGIVPEKKDDTKAQLQMELHKSKWFYARLITWTNQINCKTTFHGIVLQWKIYQAFWQWSHFWFNLWLVVEGVWLKRVLERCVCVRHSTGNLPNWLPANGLVHMDEFSQVQCWGCRRKQHKLLWGIKAKPSPSWTDQLQNEPYDLDCGVLTACSFTWGLRYLNGEGRWNSPRTLINLS